MLFFVIVLVWDGLDVDYEISIFSVSSLFRSWFYEILVGDEGSVLVRDREVKVVK